MRRAWQSAQIDNERLAAENRRLAYQLASGRVNSSLRRLRNEYIAVTAIAVILPFLAPTLVYVLGMPVWCAVVYALFGVVMVIVNGAFARWLDSLDLMSMSVRQALGCTDTLLSRQRTVRYIGIVGGCVVIGSIAFCAADFADGYILVGFGVGLIIGLIIGYIKHLHMKRLARSIRDELASLESEEAS